MNCYLLEHALVRYSIDCSLSLSAGSCLSNQPNLVTPQGQCRFGDKKGEYGRQLNHGHALAVIVIVQERVLPSNQAANQVRNDVMLIPAPSFLKMESYIGGCK